MSPTYFLGIETTRLKTRHTASVDGLRLVWGSTRLTWILMVTHRYHRLSNPHACVHSPSAPHLLCVCGGGDGGGAGAGGHPVILAFTIWLLISTERVDVSIAAEHEAQSLQRLKREESQQTHTLTSCCRFSIPLRLTGTELTDLFGKVHAKLSKAVPELTTDGKWITLPSSVTELSLGKALSHWTAAAVRL